MGKHIKKIAETIKEEEPLILPMTFEQAMKKALSTPLPKKKKKITPPPATPSQDYAVD